MGFTFEIVCFAEQVFVDHVYNRHCTTAIKCSAEFNINPAERSSNLIGGNVMYKTEYNTVLVVQ